MLQTCDSLYRLVMGFVLIAEVCQLFTFMMRGFVGGDSYELHYKDIMHFTVANVDWQCNIFGGHPVCRIYEQQRHRAACTMTYIKIKY